MRIAAPNAHGRGPARALALASFAFLVSLPAFAPAPARAGVPRACIHPTSDPIACNRAYRIERLDVLGSARVRELERLEREFEQVAPIQQAERNRLLQQIRDLVRDRARRR